MVEDIGTRFADTDLSAVDESVLVELVAAAPAEQLEAALAEPQLRGRLLDEIFRRMGSHVKVDKVRNMHAVIRWRLTGGSGPGGYDRYQCVLSDGACVVSTEMTEQARVTITLSAPNFVRLITQHATPAVLFITGKLQVQGDLGFAAGLIGYFDLPSA